MTDYEYQSFSARSAGNQSKISKINAEAADGWRLITVDNGFAYMERAKLPRKERLFAEPGPDATKPHDFEEEPGDSYCHWCGWNRLSRVHQLAIWQGQEPASQDCRDGYHGGPCVNCECPCHHPVTAGAR